jgi:hypothetical protein
MRERLKPLELVGLAAVFGAFTGVVVLVATRDGGLAVIFGGVAFILGLLVLAMLALVATPPEDRGEGPVLDREKRPRGH